MESGFLQEKERGQWQELKRVSILVLMESGFLLTAVAPIAIGIIAFLSLF